MIACLGSPIIDTIVEIDTGFYEKHCLQAETANIGRIGDEIFLDIDNFATRQVILGGSVLNTARVLKWILSANKEVAFIGAVGDDGFVFEDALKNEGIIVSGLKYLPGFSGRCAVLVENGKRTLYTDLGVSGAFTLQHLLETNILDLLKKSDTIYISAFFLCVSPQCVQEIIKLCQMDHKKLVINLGAAFLCRKYPRLMHEIFASSDLVFGNEMELLSFAESLHMQNDDIKLVAASMANYRNDGNRTMVITRGKLPALLINTEKIEEFPILFDDSTVVDSNGAGDAFAGGFMAAMALGKDNNVCMQCGQWAATEVIKNVGCTFDKNKHFYFKME